MDGDFIVHTGGGKLNMRDQPSTETGRVISRLNDGQHVARIDGTREDGWWRVHVPGRMFSASDGWVSSGYLIPAKADVPVDTIDQLDVATTIKRLCPNAPTALVAGASAVFSVEFKKHGFTTPIQVAHFLAQCAHESQGFTSLTEKYAKGTTPEKYFSKYETPKKAKELGNTDAGDGARFRGRGLIQITGRGNYAAASDALSIDLVNNPTEATKPENAARTALWFWSANNINALCTGDSDDDVLRVSSAVNRGWSPAKGPVKTPDKPEARLALFRKALLILHETCPQAAPLAA